MGGEETTRSTQDKEGRNEDNRSNKDKKPTGIPIKDKPTTHEPTAGAEEETTEAKNEREEQEDYKHHHPDSIEKELGRMLQDEEGAVRDANDHGEYKAMPVGSATAGAEGG